MDSGDNPSLVVGTGGHVDHGKSTLVKVLTGVDPDRLPQEKQRGMTIELGFCSFSTPSGRVISFVDVPGHERFVNTMVAGATGIDAGLLVVAADESVMPQTREHVVILNLLRVRPCLVVISKIDLAEPGDVEIVEEDIRATVAGTTFEGAEIVRVSAKTGHGLKELVGKLELLAARAQSERPDVTRLVVDRVFTMAGFGTVVTGPSTGAGFGVGDSVTIHPGRRQARIRGVQQHGELVGRVEHGRTALNLSGIDRKSIRRGDVFAAPGTMTDCRRFAGKVSLIAESSVVLKANVEINVHAGAAATSARVFPLDSGSLEPGESGWAVFRLSRPVAVWRGQRFILRVPSPAETIGGGIVCDVAPPTRIAAIRTDQLRKLLSTDPKLVIEAVLDGAALDLDAIVARSGLSRERVMEALGAIIAKGAISQMGSRYIGAQALAALETKIESIVAGRTVESGFIATEEIRRATGLQPPELADVLKRLEAKGTVAINPARTSNAAGTVGRAVSLSPAGRDQGGDADDDPTGLAGRILAALEAAGLQPPSPDELKSASGADARALRWLEQSGQVVRLESWLCLSSHMLDVMVSRAVQLLERQGSMTMSELRQELGTSRKYALAYGEYLDSRRITRRVGDRREPGKAFEQVKQLAHSG